MELAPDSVLVGQEAKSKAGFWDKKDPPCLGLLGSKVADFGAVLQKKRFHSQSLILNFGDTWNLVSKSALRATGFAGHFWGKIWCENTHQKLGFIF